MKKFICILIILSCSAHSVKSDTLFLKNGEQLNGELLSVTPAGLIFEMRLNGIFVEYRTYPINEVLKVVDPKKDLFNDNKLLVLYLSDYYDPPRNPYAEKNRRLYLYADIYDTLYLNDHSTLIVKIKDINRASLSYTLFREPGETQAIPLYQISLINGQPVDIYQRIYWSPPSERSFNYPYIGIEFGFGKTSTHLGKISDLIVFPGEGEGPYQFRSIDNNYTSMQLGFLIHLSPYFTAAILGHYSSGFEETTYDEEQDESFYLALAELRVGYPISIVKPWIGIGIAHQSLTLISNLPSLDAVWKSQTNGIAYSAGLELTVSSPLHLYTSGHWLPFTAKQIVAADPAKVDLANLVICGGLKIVF